MCNSVGSVRWPLHGIGQGPRAGAAYTPQLPVQATLPRSPSPAVAQEARRALCSSAPLLEPECASGRWAVRQPYPGALVQPSLGKAGRALCSSAPLLEPECASGRWAVRQPYPGALVQPSLGKPGGRCPVQHHCLSLSAPAAGGRCSARPQGSGPT